MRNFRTTLPTLCGSGTHYLLCYPRSPSLAQSACGQHNTWLGFHAANAAVLCPPRGNLSYYTWQRRHTWSSFRQYPGEVSLKKKNRYKVSSYKQNSNSIVMKMLQSNWLSHRKRSVISTRWLDLIGKMTTFSSMFSEVFEEYLETEMKDQIPGKTAKRRRRSRLLAP